MPLNDREIKELCDQGLVVPYHSKYVNPSSLDIRIGKRIKLMRKRFLYYPVRLLAAIFKIQIFLTLLEEQVYWEFLSISLTSKDDPFYLLPEDKILAESLETFNFPVNISGQFVLKSSRGREFYEHLMAGYCDPGWNSSVLTLEIENRSLKPLPIYYGFPIGQIIFERMIPPEQDYSKTGRYNNDPQVQESRG